MPTYDYLCDVCEHTFEEFQAMSAKLLVKCPACGKRKLRRLFGTGAGIIFKGSGFYETDYKKKTGMRDEEPKPVSKSDSKAESKSDGKSDGKSDAKSDAPSKSRSGKRAGKGD